MEVAAGFDFYAGYFAYHNAFGEDAGVSAGFDDVVFFDEGVFGYGIEAHVLWAAPVPYEGAEVSFIFDTGTNSDVAVEYRHDTGEVIGYFADYAYDSFATDYAHIAPYAAVATSVEGKVVVVAGDVVVDNAGGYVGELLLIDGVVYKFLGVIVVEFGGV